MRNSLTTSCALLFLFLSSSAFAEVSVPDLMKQSRSLAAKKQYEQAHKKLAQALKQEPLNIDIKLAQARLFNWQQEPKKAQDIIDALPEAQRNTADALSLQGYVFYNQQKFEEALDAFARALKKAPKDKETQAAHERVLKALHTSKTYHWQIDLGHEISEFTRRDRSNWGQTDLRLSYFAPQRKWSAFTAVQHYQRNKQKDTMLHVGGAYRFTKDTAGYAWTAITPEPYYRPEFSLAAGGQSVIDKSIVPLSFLLDTKLEIYTRTNSFTLKPGIRIDPFDGWGASGRFISVTTKDSRPLYGWSTRIDGTAFDTVKIFGGISTAPEYEDGTTVTTQSAFGGFGFDLTPNMGVRLSYAREVREQSYIRHLYYVGTSYKF